MSKTNQQSPKKRLLTLKEAAEFIQMSPRWFRDHDCQTDTYYIPRIRIGRRLYFEQVDLENFMSNMKFGKKRK